MTDIGQLYTETKDMYVKEHHRIPTKAHEEEHLGLEIQEEHLG